ARRASLRLLRFIGLGGIAQAPCAQVVELVLGALLVHPGLFGPVAVGELLEHVGLSAGQQQAGAFDIALVAVVIDHAALLRDGGVQPFAEGEAVGQQGRAGHRRCRRGVFVGIPAQRLQARLLLGQHAILLRHPAGDIVLALLLHLEQWIESLRSHGCYVSWVGACGVSDTSSSRRASASRLDWTSAASLTSWPRKAWIAGQRA